MRCGTPAARHAARTASVPPTLIASYSVRGPHGGGRAAQWVEPFAVPMQVLRHLPSLPRRLRDWAEVLPVVLKQTLLRPAPFFAIVSTLIGYSVLYIFHRAFADGDLALRSLDELPVLAIARCWARGTSSRWRPRSPGSC